MQHDAVEMDGWMSNAQFLDGLAVAYRWKAKWSVLVEVGGAALLGLLLLR